jgi:Flp pilus assembly protein TadB
VLSAAVLAGVALIAGLPIPVAVVAALALVGPWWLLAGAAGWGILSRVRRPRPPGPTDEAAFLRGLAAEIAAGASLRQAVVAAADRAPALPLQRAVRGAAAGMPAEEVGEALRAALPVNGTLAAAAFRLAAGTGGKVGAVMHTLAERASEVGRLERERRALSAQARASAWIVGGAPFLLLAGLGLTGRLGPLVSDPAGPVVLAVGLGLQAAGAATVWLMLRGSHR